jgi:hypothetical protein
MGKEPGSWKKEDGGSLKPRVGPWPKCNESIMFAMRRLEPAVDLRSRIKASHNQGAGAAVGCESAMQRNDCLDLTAASSLEEE